MTFFQDACDYHFIMGKEQRLKQARSQHLEILFLMHHKTSEYLYEKTAVFLSEKSHLLVEEFNTRLFGILVTWSLGPK